MRCAHCRRGVYCSHICRRQHWTTHQYLCSELVEVRAADGMMGLFARRAFAVGEELVRERPLAWVRDGGSAPPAGAVELALLQSSGGGKGDHRPHGFGEGGEAMATPRRRRRWGAGRARGAGREGDCRCHAGGSGSNSGSETDEEYRPAHSGCLPEPKQQRRRDDGYGNDPGGGGFAEDCDDSEDERQCTARHARAMTEAGAGFFGTIESGATGQYDSDHSDTDSMVASSKSSSASDSSDAGDGSMSGGGSNSSSSSSSSSSGSGSGSGSGSSGNSGSSGSSGSDDEEEELIDEDAAHADARLEDVFRHLPEHRGMLLLELADCGTLAAECPAALPSLHRGRHVRGIFRTNCLPLGPLGADSEIWGLFAVACRVNHACKPNARFLWRSDLQRELLIAMRPIANGEEITVSYSPQHALQLARAGFGKPGQLPGGVGTYNEARAARREYLRTEFNFECGCATCAVPCEESDERLFQIGWLLDHVHVIGDADPARALDLCERILCLMAAEDADTPADRGAVHSAALEMSILAGDMDQLREHASAALECVRLCEGATTPSIAVLKGKLRDSRLRLRSQRPVPAPR